MLADLDLLLTAVFCTADDLLPEREKNARRSVTDAEVVTLAVSEGPALAPLWAGSGRLLASLRCVAADGGRRDCVRCHRVA